MSKAGMDTEIGDKRLGEIGVKIVVSKNKTARHHICGIWPRRHDV